MPVIPCAVAVALRLRTLLAPPRCRHETEVCIEARGEQRVCAVSRAPFSHPHPSSRTARAVLRSRIKVALAEWLDCDGGTRTSFCRFCS